MYSSVLLPANGLWDKWGGRAYVTSELMSVTPTHKIEVYGCLTYRTYYIDDIGWKLIVRRTERVEELTRVVCWGQ